MNELLTKYAQRYIKDGLAKCTAKQIMLFKRMYSHADLDAEIESIVENMPNEKLDWAMQQVQKTTTTPH